MNNAVANRKAVSPADGPVAVTGASGYIGSWIVRDLMEQGYRVRACVRDRGIPAKVDHLLALNNAGLRGQVELYEGDLFKAGSYDQAFAGCCAVIHTGATVGYNQETAQQVYDGCFTEVQHVIDSVKKAGTVTRFVFTSSFSAAVHPCPEGYVFTERDWAGDNVDGYHGKWTEDNISKDRDIAYAMGKSRAEKMLYAEGAAGHFDCMAILPVHVLGPLMGANHDQPGSWQDCIRFMLKGKPYIKSKEGRMLWNTVDVRDVARAHRLCAETNVGTNGSRYILAASDRSGMLFTWQMQARLQELFPQVREVGGEPMSDGKPVKRTYDSPRTYCLLARQELGLETHSINETLRATGNSLYRLGLLP